MTSTYDDRPRVGRDLSPEDRVLGYRRNKNRFGIRNHVAVVPTVFCANRVASEIAEAFEGVRWGARDENRVLYLGHSVGCCSIGFDEETAIDVLMGLAQNPNVGGVLLVHLGCGQLCTGCGATGKPAASGRLNLLLRSLSGVLKADTIIHSGGSRTAIEQGREKVERMIAKLDLQERSEFHVGNLAIGVMNGSSDPTSGLFANPAVGHLADWLLGRGGRVAFSQTVEMLGAEDAVFERLGGEDAPARQRSVRLRVEKQLWRTTAMRVAVEGLGIESEPTPGNRRGGISTLAEKSIGTLFKIGHDPRHRIVDVLPHGKTMSSKPGIHLVDGPGQDVLCLTALTAAGAHLILFTTGRGTPTGSPIAPTVKVTANSTTFHRLDAEASAGGDIDVLIPVEEIFESGKALEQIAHETLVPAVRSIANGERRTTAEARGQADLQVRQLWPID